MKIKQLIKQLQKLDQNAEIVLPTDAEGNGFNLLHEVGEPTKYRKTDEYPYLEFFDVDNETEWNEICYEYELETPKQKGDFKKSLKEAVILWPQ